MRVYSHKYYFKMRWKRLIKEINGKYVDRD